MTTATPLVSIVIPSYNAGTYIDSTIRSVLAQDYSAWEMLVVDDCSNDNTREVVQSYSRHDLRIKLVCLNSNHGAPATPRNIGVREAQGDWIAFLDADDLWHPQKLRLQMEVILQSGVPLCSTSMIDFSDEQLLTFDRISHPRTRRVNFLSQLIRSQIPMSSVIVKRSFVMAHPFNPDSQYKAREDYECWLHCLEELGWSLKINTPLMAYRRSQMQISGSKSLMIARHFHVLRYYRFRGGRKLGRVAAAFFTGTHFLLAIPNRVFLGRL